MLIIKIELRSARTGMTSEIGRMHISNISGGGKGRYDKRADYLVEVMQRGSKRKVCRSGYVKNYPRLSYNVWRLVLRGLKECFHEERDSTRQED